MIEKDSRQSSIKANAFNFDVWYAEAWSRKQGNFSFKLANNLIRFLKANNINIKSVLDVCSGSGEFISVLRNICTDCVGVDNAEGYLDYVRPKFQDVDFKKVDYLYEFNLKRKFDVISCNRDVVNMFTNWTQWQLFFKTVFNHLNKRGIFIFDFYTKKKLDGWQEIVYEQGADLDYVSKVSQNNGLCVMNETYYVKETSTLYRKTGDIMVEAWFETEAIIKELETQGFKDIKLMDIDFNEVREYKDLNRIHIMARKWGVLWKSQK